MRRSPSTRRAVSIAAASIVGTLAGCASPDAPADEDAARIIVRFRPGSGNPDDATFRARLAAAAAVPRIDFVRPMSGDAFVMRVVCGPSTAASPDPCPAALTRLRDTAPVTDVEVDARVRTRR